MLSQRVKGTSLCFPNDSNAPGADRVDMQSVDLLRVVSLVFPTPAALGDSGALLLVIESSVLRLPAAPGSSAWMAQPWSKLPMCLLLSWGSGGC